MLAESDREWLLAWARRAIVEHLAGQKAETEPPPPTTAIASSFVTLHTAGGGLRGCIGNFTFEQPLWRDVHDMAIAAATRDPRFSPVQSAEVDDLHVEISVLSVPEAIAAEAVQVGKHGLLISQGMRRGVLLPQVPVDHGWDRDAFLAHTCQKANLPSDAWRDASTTIEAFTADVFAE